MQRKEGFTLVELMIYSVIFAGVSLTLVYFLSTFFRVSGYQASSSEVANQANFILGKIQNEIATSAIVVVNDTATSTPAYDETDDALNQPHAHLILKTRAETTGDASDSQSPVLIYKSGTDVMLKRGNGAATALNNSSVAVTNLAFTKVSTPPGKDVVLIDLTLQYQSPNAVDRISRDFSLGVSRAQAAAFDSNLSPNGSGYSLGTGAAKWASLFLSGPADIGGPLSIGNTANNSISFIKQGTLVVNPNANIPANTTTQIFVSSGTYPELAGIRAGDRVFLTPPAGSTAASRLEVGISFIGARTLDDSIEINLRNTTGAAIFAGSHNWGYLVIR